jgi:hypothetical protein
LNQPSRKMSGAFRRAHLLRKYLPAEPYHSTSCNESLIGLRLPTSAAMLGAICRLTEAARWLHLFAGLVGCGSGKFASQPRSLGQSISFKDVLFESVFECFRAIEGSFSAPVITSRNVRNCWGSALRR